jgi:hypothetical protein
MYAQLIEAVVLALSKLLSYALAFVAGKKSAEAATDKKLLDSERQAAMAHDAVDRADDNELDRLREKWTNRASK